MSDNYIQAENLPVNSSCFLCNIIVPGDAKDLFEHFRSVHFTNSGNSSPSHFNFDHIAPIQFPQYETISSDESTSTSMETQLDVDVMKWTTDDVAHKLHSEGFSSSIIDQLKGRTTRAAILSFFLIV